MGSPTAKPQAMSGNRLGPRRRVWGCAGRPGWIRGVRGVAARRPDAAGDRPRDRSQARGTRPGGAAV